MLHLRAEAALEFSLDMFRLSVAAPLTNAIAALLRRRPSVRALEFGHFREVPCRVILSEDIMGLRARHHA